MKKVERSEFSPHVSAHPFHSSVSVGLSYMYCDSVVDAVREVVSLSKCHFEFIVNIVIAFRIFPTMLMKA